VQLAMVSDFRMGSGVTVPSKAIITFNQSSLMLGELERVKARIQHHGLP
jgi:hypothetical protein